MKLVFVCLFANVLYGQSIDGALTDTVHQLPIPEVIVTLVGATRYNATTNDVGAFHFERVAPGPYMLDITKAGFVLPSNRRGPIQVDSDMRLPVRMDPLSRVEGRVRYQDGREASAASVWLSPQSGSASTKTVTADFVGRFVLDDVRPGNYVVRAAASKETHPEGETSAATYFPNSLEREGAQIIHVVPGMVAESDIRLRSVPARHIRGMVRDDAGRAVSGAKVEMRAANGPLLPLSVETGEEGTFDFLAHDGEWRFSATRNNSRGLASLTVAKHDVEGFEIRLALPFSLPKIVERDEPLDQKGRKFPEILRLSRTDGFSILQRQSDGPFQNVYPGKYRISVMGSTPGVYVESIKLGETEVSGRDFDIWDSSLPIRITYRRGAPLLRGVVEDAPGAKVAVTSTDDGVGAGFLTVTADGHGRFEIASLRPGDYYILAFTSDDTLPGTAAFRAMVLPQATKVHLEKGGTAMVDLKITPLP